MDLHPANTSFRVKVSFSNSAPAMAVVIGLKKVKTVASDSERYCKL